jgi:uncharacterized protein involved in exopolysaccharide biosynthesis
MEEKEDIITIDFKALFKILWKERLWILLVSSVFTLGGIWYAFTALEEFVSEGKLLPEVNTGSSGKLNGLAGLAALGGFDLSGATNSEAIRPDLYPDILRSTPFFLTLFKQVIVTKEGIKLNFEKYYHTVIEKNEPIEEKKLEYFKAKPSGVLVLNRLNELRIEDLRNRIVAKIDKKTGILTISVKMPDPIVAGDVAKFSIDYLTEYITDYRTEKARKEVDFIGEKVAASKGKFYASQEKKAKYSDQFAAPTIRLQTADVQRERIEADYKISSTFYNELLKKYEEAKIKLQQETPVFKVYEPPVAPTLKSEPKRAIIILISSIVGCFFGFVLSLLKNGNFKSIIK